MILGLGHCARSGKDTAADALVADGWRKLSFADPVRAMTLAANPLIAALVDRGGWEQAKLHGEVIVALEEMGRQIRSWFGPEALVNALFDRVGDDDVVIPDVRFPSEVHRIKEAGGLVIRIDRPGVGPSRPSDRHLIGHQFDRVITNSGTAEDLRSRIRRAVEVG